MGGTKRKMDAVSPSPGGPQDGGGAAKRHAPARTTRSTVHMDQVRVSFQTKGFELVFRVRKNDTFQHNNVAIAKRWICGLQDSDMKTESTHQEQEIEHLQATDAAATEQEVRLKRVLEFVEP